MAHLIELCTLVYPQRFGATLADDLDVGQHFRNTYEQSKFEAECLISRVRGQLPITVLRPSIIVGERDHTVPPVLAKAAFKRQRRNVGVTEFAEIPDRGHSLTIDDGWREVAETALEFVRRFA